MIEHCEICVVDEQDREQALAALKNLLAGAKTMIQLSERAGMVAENDKETLVIPLELDHEISILIRKDYIPDQRH